MDYNIYIHNDTTSQDQTTPWSPTETTESGGFGGGSFSSGIASSMTRALGYARNPDSVVASAVGKAAKTIPWVAVAFAVVKLCDQVVEDSISIYTIPTGDYRFATQYQNFKNGLKAALTPVSSTINYLKTKQEINFENKKKSAERQLFGDDIINGGAFYGV